MSSEYEDRPRTCADCGREFIRSAGEQEFFQEKNFADPPKRCKDCRQAGRAQKRDDAREGGNG